MGKLDLSEIDPSSHPFGDDKEKVQDSTEKLQRKLYDLLYLMFAHGKYSLLIILHGIDTSGKDGVVQHIFSGCNPQGMKVFSFKKPSHEDYLHDFLWRCHLHTPESGLAAIFNRSYYEEVSTVMVHPKFLLEQHIPKEIINRKDFFLQRYKRINDFERLLTERGTLVVKLFLHISKGEQKKRILERLSNRSKNWKFSLEDIKERRHWNHYMNSFEQMINATSTRHSPWTIIPANNKWYRDYMVSKILVERLEQLKMSFPKAKDANITFK